MYTTLTLFTLRAGHRYWGLTQMGTSPGVLRRVPGLDFFQLLGSGAANGFGWLPNLDRYGLLAVWTSEAASQEFFGRHPLWASYERRSRETWTVGLAPLRSQGTWNGRNPFADTKAEAAEVAAKSAKFTSLAAGPLAVLTRASIRLGQARRFWRHVEPTSRALAAAPGVRLAIGLGELPLVRQATFSVWESAEAMQHYAYRDARHREAIQLTREQNWYGEELFARFRVLGSAGTVDGREPLGTKLEPL